MVGAMAATHLCASGGSAAGLRSWKQNDLKLSMCSQKDAAVSFPASNAVVRASPALLCARGIRSSLSPSLLVHANESESHSPLQLSTESTVIVIDNYDSFTYNLCQYLGDLGCSYEVVRNDEITIEELKERKPRGILISPGPGTPQDSGISLESISHLGSQIPIFGVCMGLQCMGEAFGGKIVRAPNGVVHGKASLVYHDEHGEEGLLAGLPSPFSACRYHSLVIERESFPVDELEITAWTEDGLIMGVRHKIYKHIQGVQFHPESIITEDGKKIIANFVKILEQKDGIDKANKELMVEAIAGK